MFEKYLEADVILQNAQENKVAIGNNLYNQVGGFMACFPVATQKTILEMIEQGKGSVSIFKVIKDQSPDLSFKEIKGFILWAKDHTRVLRLLTF